MKQKKIIDKKFIENYVKERHKEDNRNMVKHYKNYQAMQRNERFVGFLHSKEVWQPKTWQGKKVTLKSFKLDSDNAISWKDINPELDIYEEVFNKEYKAIDGPLKYRATRLHDSVCLEYITDVYDVEPELNEQLLKEVKESLTKKIKHYASKGYKKLGGVL